MQAARGRPDRRPPGRQLRLLLTGLLLAAALRPKRARPGAPAASASCPTLLLVLLGVLYAGTGVVLLFGSGLLLADWFGSLGWGTDALVDQQVAGGLVWVAAALPLVVTVLARRRSSTR